VFVEAKPFPKSPLDKIPVYSVPETLLNHHAQAMVKELVISKIHPKMGNSKTSTDLLHPQEVRG
jgi:hypothetical protein